MEVMFLTPSGELYLNWDGGLDQLLDQKDEDAWSKYSVVHDYDSDQFVYIDFHFSAPHVDDCIKH